MASTHEVLEKVQKLVRLAASDNEEEARTAAMQATRLMKEHELVLVPRSEIERIEKVIGDARELATTSKGEATQKMMIGALAGFFFAKKF
jgi:hypothetical protein